MSIETPDHPTAADQLPEGDVQVWRSVTGENNGKIHTDPECNGLSTAEKIEQKDARTLPLGWTEFCAVCSEEVRE